MSLQQLRSGAPVKDMTRFMSVESLEVELQSGKDLHLTVPLQVMKLPYFIVALMNKEA